MESIYKPEHFNSTNHIDLKEYFEKYREQLFEQQRTQDDLPDKITSFFNYDGNFSSEKQLNLNVICSVDHLTVAGEINPISNVKGAKAAALGYTPGKINDKSRSLQTVKQVEERLKDVDRNRKLLRELRDRTLHIRDNKPEGKGSPDLKPGEEVVVFIRMFRPFTYEFSQPCSENAVKFDQEFALLGSNTLAAFRDKIKCASDVVVMTEVSANPEKKSNLLPAKKLYTSGFMFIDGVFYNDFRGDDSIDNSEVIRKWALEKKIGSFETAEMNQTQIISLKPRFGYPYVYQHQGRCEHVFIFSHAKLLSNADSLYSNCYPYHSDVGGGRVLFCFICGASLPVWMVVDCDRLPQKNTPLCNDCFTSYCYINNKKVGTFKAYPFINRNGIF